MHLWQRLRTPFPPQQGTVIAKTMLGVSCSNQASSGVAVCALKL